MLVEGGADVKHKAQQDFNCLDLAIENGHEYVNNNAFYYTYNVYAWFLKMLLSRSQYACMLASVCLCVCVCPQAIKNIHLTSCTCTLLTRQPVGIVELIKED